jgi:zinc transport system substrate-binding protein
MKYLLPFIALAWLASCGDSSNPDLLELNPEVRTASWPVTSLAQALVPESITVHCSLPAGADPITWQPSREEIAVFQRAEQIVLNGAGLEGWTAGISLPSSRVIDTSRTLTSVLIIREDDLHSHGPRGTHTHAGIDPHTFLDPHQLKAMAGAIRDGFQRTWPAEAAGIEERFTRLALEIDALDKELVLLTDLLEGKTLLASHPAYDYLARRYGWSLISFDLDPETALTEEQITALSLAIQETQPCALLWESAPDSNTAAMILTRLKLPSVVWDPAESPSSGPSDDFIQRQEANAARLASLLR